VPVGEERTWSGGPERLDRAVAELFGLSRRAARACVDAGGVFVDGTRVRRQSIELKPGARVRCVREAAELSAGPTQEPRVLWADACLAVVWKPAGMPVEPTQQAAAGTLVEWFRRQGRRVTFHQRLDREATGLLVAVLDPRMNVAVARDLREGRVHRAYRVVVEGRPEGEGRWVHRQVERGSRREALPWDGPLPAPPWPPDLMVARWRRVGELDAGAVLDVLLDTGRTHQIRLQAAAEGHPVRGDARYGRAHPAGLHLSCVRVELPHPVTAAPVVVELAAQVESGGSFGAPALVPPVRRGEAPPRSLRDPRDDR
jgi:23S rRNA pseudouridine1911/1915/1917 synthase